MNEEEELKKHGGLAAPTNPNIDSVGLPYKSFAELNLNVDVCQPVRENKERILRKTITYEAIEKPFTTQPKHYVKRGCNTVRTRSIQFLDQLRALAYSLEIPLDQAKQLFSEIIGAYDRTTLKAYFGTLPGKSTRLIRRTARYQTGTFSFKNIELTQDIPKTKGYLELLGLVSYEKRGKTWFMVVENRVLVPQLVKGSEGSIDKISLTPIHDAERGVGGERGQRASEDLSPLVEGGMGGEKTLQTNNNLQGEREIRRVKVNDGNFDSFEKPKAYCRHTEAYRNEGG